MLETREGWDKIKMGKYELYAEEQQYPSHCINSKS